MEQIDPQYFLVKIAEILEQLRIPYMVTGGIAVLVWGRPRFTADIDIVVEFKSEHINGLENALKAFGKGAYIDRSAMREALARHDEFNFIDGKSGVKVDFWVLKNDPLAISRFKRRIIKEVLGEKVYFSSPEDLILSKLEWYQISQSSRHLEDIQGVLEVSGKKLDMEYLKQWAEKLGVGEILNELLKE